MKTILWDLTQRLSFSDAQLRIVDVFRPAIAGRSAGPESIAPAVVMDSAMRNCASWLAYAALRASHAPKDAQLRVGE
jgi:hypothetical protein